MTFRTVVIMNSLCRIFSSRSSLPFTYNSTKQLYSSLRCCCGNINSKQRSLLVVSNQIANFSSVGMSKPDAVKVKIVDYEYVKGLKDNCVLLIDVREPDEVKKGAIPGSVNIPLGQVENVLKNTSPEEFEQKYGHTKPVVYFPIVFSCQSGKRSFTAAETAIKLGYKDVSSYGGGYSEWAKKSKA